MASQRDACSQQRACVLVHACSHKLIPQLLYAPYTCVLAVYRLCAQQQFWGSNLDGVVAAPIDFGSPKMNDLIVYSTHLYGECGFLLYASHLSTPHLAHVAQY
jgi:hypothetical protein